MEALDRTVPASRQLVITLLPRGTPQIAQPANLPESLLRAYSREFHNDDALTWQAIAGNKPVRAGDAAGDGKFVPGFLSPNGFAYAVAAPLESPVLPGYPGAIHLYRTKDQGPFSSDELHQLQDAARDIGSTLDAIRLPKLANDAATKLNLSSRPSTKLFALDQRGLPLLRGDFARFDQTVQAAMIDLAKTSPATLDGESIGDRVQIADANKDLLTFRVITFAHHPLAKGNPATLFCLQPTCAEWSTVRPADLAADPEIARLIPALRFMRQEFHRGPTLSEISRQVHLSPFHFHRRFSELLGLTPKHFLLECQIVQAKSELLARKKDLAQIATDCGFAHQSHFTSRFKQATGLTPTRWRRAAEAHPAN